MVASITETREEYGLLDYWVIARKRWPWILLPVLLLLGASAYYTVSQADRYEASASVLLAPTASQDLLTSNSQNPGFLSRVLSNEISLAQSDAVESLIIDELQILPNVSITPEPDADVLVFVASAGDPNDAALHANTWADMYVLVKREQAVANITASTVSLQEQLEELRVERQRLRSPLDDLDARISRSANPEVAASLQSDYDRLSDDLRYELELLTAQAETIVGNLTDLQLQAQLSAVGEARIIQTAAPPAQRSNAPLSRNLALGLVVGLIIGFGLALLAETRDKTIKSATDVQDVTDLPVLASIPLAGRKAQSDLALAAHRDPDGSYADGYHKVRSSIEFASFENKIKSVLITSPSAAEGKSTTSSNLALALSSVGKKTVLVDVDFRRARIHDIYKIEQSPGLSDYVLHGAKLSSVAYSVTEPGLKDLLVVPTGTVPPNPAAFVGTSGFLDTIDWMESQADMVVLDAPPLLAVSDAHTLGKHVDAVVLTALAGQTTKPELTEVLTVLRQTGANVIGIVLIGVDDTDTYGRQYYYRRTSPASTATSEPAGSSADLWADGRGETIDLDNEAAEIKIG
ncbi:MAG: polysaccharide biosynthesis tyrosine autokinase [Actinomycetota bacterium]